jgi:hypothetical protein
MVKQRSTLATRITSVIMEMIRSMLWGRDILFKYERVCRLWSQNSRQLGSWSDFNIDEWTFDDDGLLYDWDVGVVERLLYPRITASSMRSFQIQCATHETDLNKIVIKRWPRLHHFHIRFQEVDSMWSSR